MLLIANLIFLRFGQHWALFASGGNMSKDYTCKEQAEMSVCVCETWNYLFIDSFPRSPQDSYLKVCSSQIVCLSFVPKSAEAQSIPLTEVPRFLKLQREWQNTSFRWKRKNSSKLLFNCSGNKMNLLPWRQKMLVHWQIRNGLLH